MRAHPLHGGKVEGERATFLYVVGEFGESPDRRPGDSGADHQIGAKRRVERVGVPPDRAEQAVQYVSAEMQAGPIGSASLGRRRV